MADFKLKCPDCNVRLRRVKTVDWHLEIKHIKWLYSCRRCGKGWIYYALKNQLTPEVPNGSSVDKNEPGRTEYPPGRRMKEPKRNFP